MSMEAVRVDCKKLEQLTAEEPAKYDPQSSGGVETGIRLVRGLFRTLKLGLEARIDRFIPVHHSIVPWLLEHTCLLLNVRCKGNDGLTAWSRVRGRPFNQRLIEFC